MNLDNEILFSTNEVSSLFVGLLTIRASFGKRDSRKEAIFRCSKRPKLKTGFVPI